MRAADTLPALMLRDLLRYAGDDLDMQTVIDSAVIFRGPSRIDGAPLVVVCVVTSTNSKTANMVQTYIIRADVDPQTAVIRGLDVSICGACVHRGRWDATAGRMVGRTCYVTLWQGPRVVWEKLNGPKPYRDVAGDVDAIRALGFGRLVRLGTYGDPAAVPVEVWDALLADAIAHTGYTHQWKNERIAGHLKGRLMASCDTPADRERARAAGWDTFTVAPVGEAVDGANLCPASREAGKRTTCADCLKCSGARGADIYIPAHGATAKRYTGRRALPTV